MAETNRINYSPLKRALSMNFLNTRIAMAAILLCAGSVHAQVNALSAVEIEKRNVAVTFVSTRESALFIVWSECIPVMAGTQINPEAIGKAWLSRNKGELEAAYVWLDVYMSHVRATDPPAFQRASTELVQSQASAALQSVRIAFERKLPNITSCIRALKPYELAQLDFKNMAANQGYEQFGEFAETLDRIRSDPGFKVPSHLKNGLENPAGKLRAVGKLASADAVEAVRERGDLPAQLAIFKSLAAQGDGAAAQQIGLMHVSGQGVEKNSAEAYRWFYAAWSLGELDGLNAMGVGIRDGVVKPVNLFLAQAAFYLAKAGARDQQARNRATTNLDRLAHQVSIEDKAKIACMSLAGLDEALRSPIQHLGPLTPSRGISEPHRKIGMLVKELVPGFQAAGCP